METAEAGADFTRTNAMGLEFTCHKDQAIAVKWMPTLVQRAKAEIPEAVVANGEKCNVELLSRKLFAKSVIRSVVIPKTVSFLPDQCFEYCENLCDVVFGGESRVFALGRRCFKRCDLCEFDVPDSCVVIYEKCFDGCSKLCRVHISERSRLLEIRDFAFRGCNISNLLLPNGIDLSSFGSMLVGVKSVVHAKSGVSTDVDGCLFAQHGTTLLRCFSSASVLEVPYWVDSIPYGCFAGSNVKTVIFGQMSQIKKFAGAFVGSSVGTVVFKDDSSDYAFEEGSVFEQTETGTKILVAQLTRNPELILGKDISAIGNHCFSHPEALKSVKFHDRCEDVELADGAFKETGVSEIVINGVKNLTAKCFFKCHMLKSVCFHRTMQLVEFGEKAFSMCGLERLCIPRGVKTIGERCFCGCTLLKELSFEEGSRLRTIGKKAFMNTSLTSLVIPPLVENVTGSSFYGIKHLVLSEDGYLAISGSFLIHLENQALISVVHLTELDLIVPATIRSIGCESFYRCGHIHRISFETGSKLDIIRDNAFKHCDVDELCLPRRLSSIGQNVTERVKKIFVEEGSKCFNNSEDIYLTRVLKGGSIIVMNTLRNNDAYCIPDYINTVSKLCFSHRHQCFSLSFSGSDACEMHEFDDKAFESSGLTSILVPVTTNRIGKACFQNCESLFEILFCKHCRITSLDEGCFSKLSISKIRIPSWIEVLPEKCFADCLRLESVEFESDDHLLAIGESCFAGCIGLSIFAIPGSVQRILSNAFSGTRLTDAVLPSQLVELGSHSFIIHTLSRINIGTCTSIRSIPVRCFYTSQLQSVEIPAQVSSIEEEAFSGCSRLTSVTFQEGSSLRWIKSWAFCRTGISVIALPDSVESIEFEAFAWTSLSDIILPCNLQDIQDCAFAHCPQLKTVRFHAAAKIAAITGDLIFLGTNLHQLTIPDNLVRFPATFLPVGCRVSISQGNRAFACDDQFVYNIDRSKLIRCFKSTSRIVIPRFVERIGEMCFLGCKEIREIQFEPFSVLKRIEPLAFTGLCLAELVLPRSVEELDYDLFANSEIGKLSFDSDSQLKSLDNEIIGVVHLVIPDNVKQIDTSSLAKVKKISLDPMNKYFTQEGCFLFNTNGNELCLVFLIDPMVVVQVLCRGCFSNRRQVKSVTFETGSELRLIEGGALRDSSISKFVVPQNVEKIENGAFSGCDYLKELLFEDSCVLTALTCGMFEGTHLDYLFISSNVRSIEANSCVTFAKLLFLQIICL